MGLNEMRERLISYGYHPKEVEYTIIEVLQYKRSDSLNNIDFNVLSNMLQEKLEMARAENKLNLNHYKTMKATKQLNSIASSA